MSLLEVRGLTKQFGRRRVVDCLDLTVDAGEVVGLLGSNGAGKTTALRIVFGLLRANTGRVFFAGIDVSRWPTWRLARLGIGYVAQETSIFRELTVEQNVLAVLEAGCTWRGENAWGDRLQRASDLLDRFGLAKLKDHRAVTLSGGERRRLEIARCLVLEPSLILLDEPFTGIDPESIQQVQAIIHELRDDGIGVLLTDHNVEQTIKMTDRSYVIWSGKFYAHGLPGD